MPARRHRQLLSTIALMLIGAVAELATIGSVIPFLSIVTSKADDASFGWAVRLVGTFGEAIGLGTVAAAALLLVAVASLAAYLRIMLVWVSQKFVFAIGYDLGVEVYNRMLHQPFAHHVLRNTSHTIAGLNKVQMVVFNVLLPAMTAFTSAVVALFIVTALLIVDPVAALSATACFLLIYIAISVATRRRLRANSMVVAAAQTERVQTVQEGLGGIRDVILDRAQPIFLDTFSRIDARLRAAQATNQFIALAPRYVVEAVGVLLIAVLAILINGRPGGVIGALPILGAMALGAQRLLPLVQQVYVGCSQIAGNRGMLFDVLELMNVPIESQETLSHQKLGFERVISLVNVSFRYPTGDGLALDDISLTIAKGSRIGLVGKTGSGKSTLVDLLMGLLDPGCGEMRVDGVLIDSSSKYDWRAQIAHVPQAIFLSDSTIAANIAFGRDDRDIDMARVREAARRADIDGFIASLPGGYAATVGERGMRLSGGQRQRIGIARALYKEARVLVLDEATSALDDETEAAVMRSIAGLAGDLTIIMIAHRLTTLKVCDRIIRLEGGKIVSAGTYNEIIAAAKAA